MVEPLAGGCLENHCHVFSSRAGRAHMHSLPLHNPSWCFEVLTYPCPWCLSQSHHFIASLNSLQLTIGKALDMEIEGQQSPPPPKEETEDKTTAWMCELKATVGSRAGSSAEEPCFRRGKGKGASEKKWCQH